MDEFTLAIMLEHENLIKRHQLQKYGELQNDPKSEVAKELYARFNKTKED